MDRPCQNCQQYFDIREHNGKCDNCLIDNFNQSIKTENMKYKLINLETKEEHICDKVTIDGFDYYKSDLDLSEDRVTIATTNPNIDIPQVIDEVEMMALLQYPYPLDIKDRNDKIIQTKGEKPFNYAKIEKYRRAFVIGYNKSQEAHPFNEEDMKDFLIYYLGVRLYQDKGTEKTADELLQLWEEERTKTIYYK